MIQRDKQQQIERKKYGSIVYTAWLIVADY
jgi:hypothetical protein